MHNPQNFSKNIVKWKQLGILYASDIQRNSNTPVEYNTKCDWNNLKCAYG